MGENAGRDRDLRALQSMPAFRRMPPVTSNRFDSARFLLALDEMTPPHEAMQLRDHADAGLVAERAGLAKVGDPGTRMAMAMKAAADLRVVGVIDVVKGDGGEGTIRYRITQLGERQMSAARHAAELALRDQELGRLNARAGELEAWTARLAKRVETLEKHLPWWRRWFRRLPPVEGP